MQVTWDWEDAEPVCAALLRSARATLPWFSGLPGSRGRFPLRIDRRWSILGARQGWSARNGKTTDVGPHGAQKIFNEGLNSLLIRCWLTGRPIPRPLPRAAGILRIDRQSWRSQTRRRAGWQEIRKFPAVFQRRPRISARPASAHRRDAFVASCDRCALWISLCCNIVFRRTGDLIADFSPKPLISGTNLVISGAKPPTSGTEVRRSA